jgi:hypothetical protein
MVSGKLTMIKDFLPSWFLSHTQGDRINRGGKLGLDGAAQAACRGRPRAVEARFL